ncbi:MAG: T9SS type A sorting domain-containing protein [Chitinophagaceae bacterium]|nr:T9SS type A sorting domain-containing protein [Chitinophagaceae bacterium]
MRKSFLLTAIVSCIVIFSAKAQYVNIPDSLFRIFLRDNYPSCMNAQGQLDTTCSTILSVEGLMVSSSVPGCSFRDLTGLQYFKNLKRLDMILQSCIEVFPVINSLKELHAQFVTLKLSWLPNGLKVLDVNTSSPDLYTGTAAFINDNNHFPDSLEVLNCQYAFNAPQSIPPFPQGLKYIDLSGVRYNITVDSIPSLPPNLKHFNFKNLVLGNRRLPPLPSTLTYLNGGLENPPTWGDSLVLTGPLPPQLDTFDFYGRMMEKLPEMPASLKYFSCWGTDSTTSLPVMPEGLKTFQFFLAHSLHSMPPLPNSVVDMECWEVFLDNLPSLPSSLKRFVFNMDTLLTSLPALPAGLLYFDCHSTRLSSLPPLPVSLTYLNCSNNQLTSLPVFNDGLVTALCNGNRIQQLQRIPNTMETLDLRSNNIFCLPLIPATPYPLTIKADATIKCVSNINTRLYYYQGNSSTSAIPKLCTFTNNERRCSNYPVINGYLFYDDNSNGIKDPGESVKSNARLTLGNNFTFSNDNGYYEIMADSIGPYTLTPEPWTVFFDFVPASASFNFTRYETITRQDFIIKPNATLDSVEINITCLNRLRPGFPLAYNIAYENTGSTTLVAPVVTLHYDNTKLVFDSSSVAMSQNENTLTLNTGNMAPLQQGSLTAWFRLKPTTPIGDSLIATATIAANSKIAASYSREIVRGSYDPNDKNATPQLSPLQVANGEYIDYSIRFQNTGTDTAFNIVISDTLNEDLQVNSLKMLASSHTCKTTVQGNVVFFEFFDILLPDSNVNEPGSHGFVSFRIKPQTTVQPNTTIPNKAAIYFDYNAPVITNIAGTLIKNFIVVPLKLVSFSAMPQNGNSTALYWNTANEINTRQFVIERGGDGLHFSSVTTVFAKGKVANNYSSTVADFTNGLVYYRLKIVDNDGSFTYSPIIKINRRKNAAGFSILSNPAKDFIILNSNDQHLNNTQGSIINTNGAVVKNFIIKQGSQTIDVKGLPTGVYYLRTMNGSERILIR